MLPFCNVVLQAQKWFPLDYPMEPVTIGDHIKKRRYELRLTQTQVASLLGVSRKIISTWETNWRSPDISLMPKIIEFLGYIPYGDFFTMSGGERIRTARRILGMSQQAAAKHIGVCDDTLSLWENDKDTPKTPNVIEALESLISSASRVAETLKSRSR